MKVLEKKYPKGTFNYQKTDGRYIDRTLYDNLKLLATKIVKDMTFMGVCSSSTLEVGTGKSVLMSQIGEIWSDIIKEVHGIDVPFTQNNIVFRPKDLIERSFNVPKYSCVLLDEWEDAHYWSELGKTLRKFFRKCRQLNLFILVIIPNYFQFPMGYAISRSIFFIDVKFDDELERGDYDFYGFKSKKNLWIKGKRFHDYSVVQPDFQGRFFDGYGVPEEEYRKAKYNDMIKYEEEEEKPINVSEIVKSLIVLLSKSLPINNVKELAEALNRKKTTGYDAISSAKEGKYQPLELPLPTSATYYNNLPRKENIPKGVVPPLEEKMEENE